MAALFLQDVFRGACHKNLAAAMSTLILLTSAAVSLLLAAASRGLLRRSQAWRQDPTP